MNKSEAESYTAAIVFGVSTFVFVASALSKKRAIKKANEQLQRERLAQMSKTLYDAYNTLFPPSHPEDAPASRDQRLYDQQFKDITSHI